MSSLISAASSVTPPQMSLESRIPRVIQSATEVIALIAGMYDPVRQQPVNIEPLFTVGLQQKNQAKAIAARMWLLEGELTVIGADAKRRGDHAVSDYCDAACYILVAMKDIIDTDRDGPQFVAMIRNHCDGQPITRLRLLASSLIEASDRSNRES